MTKEESLKVWDHIYGEDTNKTFDHSGRVIFRDRCEQRREGGWVAMHIRPTGLSGLDTINNMFIVNVKTKPEKQNNFPTWKANGRTFKAVENNDTYDIIDLDDKYEE